MKRTPLILGAIPLTIFTGALIGTAVATEPIGRAGDPLEQIPQHEIETRTAEEARAMTASRNHYPLKTPQGVIEVRELSYHGRLRNRLRDQPFYGATSESEAFATAGEELRLDADYAQNETRELPANFVPLESGVFENTSATRPVEDTHGEPERSAVEQQRTAFAERDAALQGEARVIDVEAQLEMVD